MTRAGRSPVTPRGSRSRRWWVPAAIAAVVLVAVIVVIALSTSTTPAPPQLFAPNSVWNARLPANAPISVHSGLYVADLENELHSGEWINTTPYSVPLYTVGADQPLVPVTLDQSGPGSVDELARVFKAGVPIPADAHAAAGTDQSLVVWQPAHNVLWEFWRAHKIDGVWHALWGGKMTDVSGNPGYFDDPSDWGSSATSLPLLGGLMLISQLRSGHIDHALAMAIPSAAAGRFVYPAQRDDGHDPSPDAIPEGTRFRLNPNLDINALRLPPVTRMIAVAAQRYGIIVRDQSGSVSFYAQDPTTTGSNPYGGPHGLFDGMAPDVLLRHFPWSQLEVVSPSWRPQ